MTVRLNDDLSKSRRVSGERRWSIEALQPPISSTDAPSLELRYTEGAEVMGDEDMLLADGVSAKLVNDGVYVDPESDPMLDVLRKPADARGEEELASLRQTTSMVKFFHQMKDSTLHHELCRHMTLEQARDDWVTTCLCLFLH